MSSLAAHREASTRDALAQMMPAYFERARCLGADAMVSLETESCEPGSYRVMHALAIRQDLTAEQASEGSRWPDTEAVEPLKGGVIGALIEAGEPRATETADTLRDPVLREAFGDSLDDWPRAVAVPVFYGGLVSEWAIFFGRDLRAGETELTAMSDMSNLLSRSATDQHLLTEIRRLNGVLDQRIQELGRLQQSLLPSLPDEDGVSFAAAYHPSEAAGGDYYDFRTFEDGRIGAFIADASGHGPAASVAIAMMRAAMHAFRLVGRQAADTVPDVNRVLCESLRDGSFVTAFFLALDPKTGEASFLNAGHPTPRIRRASGEVVPLDGESSMPMGIVTEIEPQGGETVLRPGDAVLLYTDGITEAFSPSGAMFGTESLDACLSAAGPDPDQMVKAVLTATESHGAGRPFHDDRTLLALSLDSAGRSVR